ncbi:unnamed protein product [Arctogadus glacialis]
MFWLYSLTLNEFGSVFCSSVRFVCMVCVLRKLKLLYLNLFLLMRSHTGMQMCVDGKVDSQLVLGEWMWECDRLDSVT